MYRNLPCVPFKVQALAIFGLYALPKKRRIKEHPIWLVIAKVANTRWDPPTISETLPTPFWNPQTSQKYSTTLNSTYTYTLKEVKGCSVCLPHAVLWRPLLGLYCLGYGSRVWKNFAPETRRFRASRLPCASQMLYMSCTC